MDTAIEAPTVGKKEASSGSAMMEKTITLEEVAMHATSKDCYLAIEGKVYDVTKFIYKHPGSLAILKGVGKDATSIFDKIGHSNRARNIMRKYYIGNIKL